MIPSLQIIHDVLAANHSFAYKRCRNSSGRVTRQGQREVIFIVPYGEGGERQQPGVKQERQARKMKDLEETEWV